MFFSKIGLKNNFSWTWINGKSNLFRAHYIRMAKFWSDLLKVFRIISVGKSRVASGKNTILAIFCICSRSYLSENITREYQNTIFFYKNNCNFIQQKVLRMWSLCLSLFTPNIWNSNWKAYQTFLHLYLLELGWTNFFCSRAGPLFITLIVLLVANFFLLVCLKVGERLGRPLPIF